MEDLNSEEFIEYLLENFPTPPPGYEVKGPLWEILEEFAKVSFVHHFDSPKAAHLMGTPLEIFCSGVRMGSRFIWTVIDGVYKEWTAKRLLED